MPTLADPFLKDDPLPGAYQLHLPSDGVTIWHTVTPYEGQGIISIWHVKLDTWPAAEQRERATGIEPA